MAMRHYLSAATLLLLAGCGATPIPVIPVPAPVASAPPGLRGPLIGLDTNALLARLGPPRLRFPVGATWLPGHPDTSGRGDRGHRRSRPTAAANASPRAA